MTYAAARAALITGVYGTGKTSVAVEVSDLLGDRGEPHAVLDLDWLMWFSAPGHPDEDHAMMLRNLAPVVANYRAAGVRTFLLARATRDRAELDSLRSALSMPLRVVRSTVPIDRAAAQRRRDLRPPRRPGNGPGVACRRHRDRPGGPHRRERPSGAGGGGADHRPAGLGVVSGR
jgi:adenylylsulfate kinase